MQLLTESDSINRVRELHNEALVNALSNSISRSLSSFDVINPNIKERLIESIKSTFPRSVNIPGTYLLGSRELSTTFKGKNLVVQTVGALLYTDLLDEYVENNYPGVSRFHLLTKGCTTIHFDHRGFYVRVSINDVSKIRLIERLRLEDDICIENGAVIWVIPDVDDITDMRPISETLLQSLDVYIKLITRFYKWNFLSKL